jgi:type I restriction enzyme S subunit
LPAYDSQFWFGELFAKNEEIGRLQAEAAAGREAILPSILDRTFRGEL